MRQYNNARSRLLAWITHKILWIITTKVATMPIQAAEMRIKTQMRMLLKETKGIGTRTQIETKTKATENRKIK